MWALLLQCWNHDPTARPTALEVLNSVRIVLHNGWYIHSTAVLFVDSLVMSFDGRNKSGRPIRCQCVRDSDYFYDPYDRLLAFR